MQYIGYIACYLIGEYNIFMIQLKKQKQNIQIELIKISIKSIINIIFILISIIKHITYNKHISYHNRLYYN